MSVELTLEEIKLIWLAKLYEDYPVSIFNFSFHRPVKDYHPEVTSQIIKTDSTECVAFASYLTCYNHKEGLTYVVPLVYGIGLDTVKMLLDSMMIERGF
jgi:hypothetical protein